MRQRASKQIAFGLALAAAMAATIAALPARAAPNPALCFALAENFNQCQRQAQRQGRGGYGYDGGGYGGGYGHDGGGYGYDGGGWGDDDPYAWRRRRSGRAQAKQAECARWLVAMQQNNCMP